jgi:hypothetical protein
LTLRRKEAVREASSIEAPRTDVAIAKKNEVPMELLDRPRGAVKVRVPDTLTATKNVEGRNRTEEMFGFRKEMSSVVDFFCFPSSKIMK